MPRINSDFVPTYRRHKQSGQAIVSIGGFDHLLGPWQSKASKSAYDRIIGEWLAAGRVVVTQASPTVAELLNGYRRHCEAAYPSIEGRRCSEADNIRHALRPLRKLYGSTPADEFGPLKLKSLIAEFIRLGWCRKNINRQIGRVKHFFKWAVGNEMLPANVLHGLQAVDGLRRGRTEAPETMPIKPVALEHVYAIRPHVSRQVWAMVELQLFAGMRPGEVVLMRGCDIDTTGQLWTYRPQRHKTQNHGIDRIIYLGPKSIEVLRPWLRTDTNANLFSPAEAEAERRERLHIARKTPLSCGNKPGTNRRKKPQRTPGDCYSREVYTRAIYVGNLKAFPYPDSLSDGQKAKWRADHFWSANQLRHTAATMIRKQFGAESAQVILGHTQLRTTELYAERNHEAAMQIMAKVG